MSIYSHHRYPLLTAYLHGNASQNSGGGAMPDSILAEFGNVHECELAEAQLREFLAGFPGEVTAVAFALGGATESGYLIRVPTPNDSVGPDDDPVVPPMFELILNRMY